MSMNTRMNLPDGLIVRDAVRSDIPSLAALERECFSEPWSEKGFDEFFESGSSVCLAAEKDGVVVGYIGATLSFGDAAVTNIAVTKDFRRIGVGTALIEAMRSRGDASRLLLEVRESNTAARSFYERNGFRVDGKRKNFYSFPREDAVLMSLG